MTQYNTNKQMSLLYFFLNNQPDAPIIQIILL
jgi:hypothetical protein